MNKFIRCTGLTPYQALKTGKLLAEKEGAEVTHGFEETFLENFEPSDVLVIQYGMLMHRGSAFPLVGFEEVRVYLKDWILAPSKVKVDPPKP